MKWDLSTFGKNLCEGSGIGELMDDLGEALAKGDDIKMLGGGQPAHVPEMDAMWRQRMEEIMSEPEALEKMLGNYDAPIGNEAFRKAVADLFRKEFGWKLSEKNIAITMGGQTAFFFLFNALAGEQAGAAGKKVLFPLCPEYLGYAEVGLSDEMFTSVRPSIDIDADANLYKCVVPLLASHTQHIQTK